MDYQAPIRIVEDAEVEKALDWLRDNAAEMGAAKERAVRANSMLKRVKAIEMKKYNHLSVSAQEREALASEAYEAALLEDAIAAGDYEKLRALRDAAHMKIEAWRSQQANFRRMSIQ